MSAHLWNTTVIDSPDSNPYTVVGDLVLVIRTPRSRDFITVEVGLASQCRDLLSPPGGMRISAEPHPCLMRHWSGEMHTGDTVDFRMVGESYHLTLARLEESVFMSPWVKCEFRLEQD